MAWSKESRQKRGYDAKWEAVRKVIIARDKGLCQMCLREGRVTQGRDVDHMKSKAECVRLGWSRAQMDEPSNLWYLCQACHRVKTEEEQGKKKNPPRPKIGPDGWPIE